MHSFPANVKHQLSNSGWYQNRKIDVEIFKQNILSENYRFTESAQTFLEEFGDLKILFYLRNGTKDFMHFDVIKAVKDISSLWIHEDYAKRINSDSLCPIGQVYSDHMTLMIDSKGSVYGGFDDELVLISSTGAGAIESIISNKTFEKIE